MSQLSRQARSRRSFPFHSIFSASNRLPSVRLHLTFSPMPSSPLYCKKLKGWKSSTWGGNSLATSHDWSLGPQILSSLGSWFWPNQHVWKFLSAFCTTRGQCFPSPILLFPSACCHSALMDSHVDIEAVILKSVVLSQEQQLTGELVKTAKILGPPRPTE